MTYALIGIGGLLLLILLIIAAFFFIPADSDQPRAVASTYAAEPVKMRQFSIREQSLNEDAAALAGEFKRVRYEKYLEELRADAATAFGGTPSKASK